MRVWIDDGCIQCRWCQDLVPQVFVCGADGTRISAEVREDGRSSSNRRERSPLTIAAARAVDGVLLQFTADGCPASVIRIATAES